MKKLTVDRVGLTLRALAVTLMLVGSCGSAAAQGLLFDWGSSEKVDDSGREAVRIKASAKPGEILVSFGDRRVYLIVEPGKALSYPIAIPREQSRWSGVTSVSMKRENPGWTPTPEMLRENPRLPSWVPGGHPMNPLGTRALYLGASDYRIHGTDAPWTIGTAASKGCVRMYNKDVQDLYPRVKVGARVTVTWNTFEVTAITDVKELESVALFAPRKSEGKRAETTDETSEAGRTDRPVKLVAVDPAVATGESRQRSDADLPRKQKPAEPAAFDSSTASDKAKAKGADRSDAKPDADKVQPEKTEKPSASSTASTDAALPTNAVAPAQSGSVATSTPPSNATTAQPSIDEATSRAMAAAERAAAAAERAAAAAEGLLAASRSQPTVPQADGTPPAPEQPAAHASAAETPPKSP